jgi:hypothetical protein
VVIARSNLPQREDCFSQHWTIAQPADRCFGLVGIKKNWEALHPLKNQAAGCIQRIA